MNKYISTLICAALPLSVAVQAAQTAADPTLVWDATADFTVIDAGQVPYYVDQRNDALGIDARKLDYRNMYAQAWREFDGETGLYDITITVLTEEDGEPNYRLMHNGKAIKIYRASYIGPGSKQDLKPETHTWHRVALSKGDKIGIESMAKTNRQIPEGEGTAWARGRWQQLEFKLSANQGPERASFDRSNDLLLAQFDSKPDADDIHTIAALGSLLAAPQFSDIKSYAVAGTVGVQQGQYINPNPLLKLAFAAENKGWTDAKQDWQASVKRTAKQVSSVLAKGGKVWVQEAGQSDFTYDWLQLLAAQGVDAALIKTNVIVIQHSAWNEQKSTASKLDYVKANTDYRAIEDGNKPKRKFDRNNRRGPLTPMFVDQDTKWLAAATSPNNSKAKARELWQTAEQIVAQSNFGKGDHKAKYSSIPAGGVDFSDLVETWWTLELNHQANSVHAFWDNYVTDVALDVVNAPAGRLAVVADGNSPDPDDIGATPIMFAMLQKAKLSDRLVHLSHSCDLDPSQNKGKQQIDAVSEVTRQQVLDELSGKSIEYFGPFKNLRDYYNCRTQQQQATQDLVDAIDASTADDPLWIIEAGEPDLIGYALQQANPKAIPHVHVVSHHPANDDSGYFFTWQQILDFGVTEHQIGDQNVGLQTPMSDWDWAENHELPGIAYIWEMLAYAERDGMVDFQTNKFDCSDAGMVYWWITGADQGGNNNATPQDIKRLLPL
ncbi:hypothetical protein IC617_04255 [Neiella sp. HB171785]|uniref:Uncharacterized protein n=2 Tax=Neiella litorisoli TaxID=2771431 RepID=A0A8J6QU73_9GAMM|nr:hypothetical protein [Neiella litorisoli]